MPSISIPTALRQYAGPQASAPVEATTVGEALDKLTAQFPDLRKHLFDANGKLRSFVNVYVNDEDIRYLQKEDTAIKEKDEISIVPSIAGGSTPAVEEALEGRSAELPELNKDELARYNRHLILPEVGLEGQRKLKAASALLFAAGFVSGRGGRRAIGFG